MADFDPTQQALSPAAQVFSHILQKGIQAGSVIGTCVVVPLTAAYATLYRKTPVDKLQLLRKVGVSSGAGMALTALLGVARLSQIGQDGMADRAYRLHYNDSQKRTDRFAAAGAAAGCAAGIVLMRNTAGAGFLEYLGATGLGTAGGVALHALTKPEDQKSPDRMLHELRT